MQQPPRQRRSQRHAAQQDGVRRPQYPDDTPRPQYPDDTPRVQYPDDTARPSYPQDSAPAQYAAPRAQYPEYPEYPAPRSRAAISPMPAARSRLISSPPRRYIRSIHRALRKTTRPRSRLTIPRAIRAAITVKPRRRAAARTMGCGCWW